MVLQRVDGKQRQEEGRIGIFKIRLDKSRPTILNTDDLIPTTFDKAASTASANSMIAGDQLGDADVLGKSIIVPWIIIVGIKSPIKRKSILQI